MIFHDKKIKNILLEFSLVLHDLYSQCLQCGTVYTVHCATVYSVHFVTVHSVHWVTVCSVHWITVYSVHLCCIVFHCTVMM